MRLELILKFETLEEMEKVTSAITRAQLETEAVSEPEESQENQFVPSTDVILTPEAQEVQEAKAEISNEDVKVLKEANAIAKMYGLRIKTSEKGGASTNVIGCWKTVIKMFDLLGGDNFGRMLYIIKKAFPDSGGEKWDARILREIGAFLHVYRNEKVNDEMLIRHIQEKPKRGRKNVPNSSPALTPRQFINKCDGNEPGATTESLYNFGRRNANKKEFLT